jgi:hypothetical protein
MSAYFSHLKNKEMIMMVEAQQKKQAKKMLWITLAMMAFSTV